MSKHAGRPDWGAAAIATLCVLIVLAVSAVAGVYLALLALTDDSGVTGRVITVGSVLVLLVADLAWMGRTARRLIGGRS